MISQLKVICTSQTNPYHNLALELYLLETVREGECILYLWQNQRSVIIGRNQLAENECDRAALEADGGFLVRRRSGGGAVYHDLGNLNFTFLMASEDYDEARQSEVILKALNGLGLDCRKTGRNDLTIDGRKFSGHAYYHHDGHSFHHGTIMLEVNRFDLERYLHVSQLKLADKHVRSVRSRVINLREVLPQLTVDQLKAALIAGFEEVYQLPCAFMDSKDIDEEAVARHEERLSSAEWINGRIRTYQHRAEGRFDWGLIRIDYDLKDGVITDCAVYTDGLQADYLEKVSAILKGKRVSELDEHLNDPGQEKINSDIISLLKGSE